MARKTKTETLRDRKIIALAAWQDAEVALREATKRLPEYAALTAAHREYESASRAHLRSHERDQRRAQRQPRHEYAVVMLDEHGDGIDTRFHDTLAAARKEAIDALPNLVGDDAEVVGTVIERVRLSDGERTTVEWHGQVSAGWRGEETVECEYCERTLPAGQVTLASSGEITVSYCDDCRAKDAKAAHG